MANIDNKKQPTQLDVLEAAYRATRTKKFIGEFSSEEIVKMSEEHKVGACFITHKFDGDTQEHNLLLIGLVPTEQPDRYIVMAEDYGLVH